jgi:phosphoglycerate dehydrogenase-like enzyme
VNATSAAFRVGLTRDLVTAAGDPSFGVAPLHLLDGAADIEWNYLPAITDTLTAADAAQYDALYVAAPRVPASVVSGSDLRVKLIARHGVGFDAVDLPAMSARGVLVTNTPDAVRRPVATAALTYVLALAQKLLIKDRLTRGGRWHERTDHMGMGLTGRTLGVIGAGSIGRETLRLARVLDMRLLAADPYADPADLTALGARLVPLETLLGEADFVCVTCALTAETHHLVDARALARMRRSAYLVNVARGPVVDEAALQDALASGRIAGAGLDVFETEPLPADHPLLKFPNVIVTPHALCWTDECFAAIAKSGLSGIVDVAQRRIPAHVVNPDVLGHPRIRAWFGG